MIHRAGRLRLATAFVLLLATAGSRRVPVQSGSVAEQAEPATVAVVGADYAFLQLPTSLAAGPTLFSFENRGTKRHEMSIALLREGVTSESLMARGAQTSVSSRAVSDSLIGLLLARPGERAGGQLYANLIAGRSYIVICTLRDTPDAQPHAALGMVGGFQVR